MPAIAQDAQSGEVLMMAYMNAESYAETAGDRPGRLLQPQPQKTVAKRRGKRQRATGQVDLRRLRPGHDPLKVEQVGGAACHEGYHSCFFRRVTPDGLEVVGQRVFDPAKFTEKEN